MQSGKSEAFSYLEMLGDRCREEKMLMEHEPPRVPNPPWPCAPPQLSFLSTRRTESKSRKERERGRFLGDPPEMGV